MRKSLAQLVAGVALLAVGVAGGWVAGAAGSRATPGAGGPAIADPGPHRVSRAAFTGRLVSYDSCAGLLTALHARGRAVVGSHGFNSGGYLPSAAGAAIAKQSTLAELMPSLPRASAGSSPAPASAPLTHSTTNTQVANVDEPDVVKTDGRYLVSLDGQLLRIVDVRSARLRATLALPHPGSELLLAGDRVVVLSGALSNGANPVSTKYYSNASAGTTTATVVTIADPGAPKVVQSWGFDAGEVAARVIGGTIRLVLSSPPPVQSWASPRDSSAAEQSRATKINQELVDATPLDAWLPHWSTDSGQRMRVSSCDAVATPAKPHGAGLVTVLSLDPQATSPGAGTSVFGAGDTGYAEGRHLYVSDSGTASGVVPVGSLGPLPPGISPSTPTVHILEFDLSNPAQARYLASGEVTGQLHDSYALSEYQDHLRVTTTTYGSASAGMTSSTGISVLERSGDKLVQIGKLGGLGSGEQVYAVRYLDDRGYVVTFQRVDPLHVVDLSNPAHPVLRGILTMAGYSSLLLPLPNHRLMGIGQRGSTAVPRCSEGVGCSGTASTGGIVEPDGLQLALFDVADAAQPRLLDRKVLSNAYASAVNDPHAVTLDPRRGLAVLPSSSGVLGVQTSGDRLTTTTGARTVPDSLPYARTVIAGERLFELTDRGVAVRNLPALHQTGWVAF